MKQPTGSFSGGFLAFALVGGSVVRWHWLTRAGAGTVSFIGAGGRAAEAAPASLSILAEA